MLLQSLKATLYGAVAEIVPERSVAVAFSGGVDSSLLAKICRDIGKNVTLITVGFPDSHDVSYSMAIASKMGMKQDVVKIELDDFRDSLGLVRKSVKCENTSHIENCIAYHYLSKAAAGAGLSVLLSANGCDELFCGYSAYRAAYSSGGVALAALMEEKISNELELVDEIATVAGQFGVAVRQPFLSSKFIEFAKSIPVESKIAGPDDLIRKHILREVALEIGVPKESAMKPKKALQYGSLIHKYFKNVRVQ
ncbi:MAG: asparagine synthase C-terminal domain-containing protein [Nitrososphaera sp.]